MTGAKLAEYLHGRSDIIDELSSLLKVPAEELVDRVGKLMQENKKLTKKLKTASAQTGTDVIGEAKKRLPRSHTPIKSNSSSTKTPA